LDVHEEILLGSAEVPTQVSLSDFAGIAKVLIIGIDFKRLLKPSQTLLLASLLLAIRPRMNFFQASICL
jgi:hypothetical protein